LKKPILTGEGPLDHPLHCHIPHHTTNNDVEQKGGGRLTMILQVAEP
jgi:hypothetical protein